MARILLDTTPSNPLNYERIQINSNRKRGKSKMLKNKLAPLTQNKAQAHMQKLMTQLLQTGETFAIWGAGATGQRAMEYLQKSWGDRVRPQYVVDNNPTLWNTGGDIPGRLFQA